VLLTCPNCRSGLQVPDGTTAMVRCPACKTVFSPTAGLAPPEPEVEEEEREEKPRKRKAEREQDEDEKPRKKQEENRDFDPLPEDHKPRRRKRPEADELTPEERAARRAAFGRAAWGCKLIYISFGLFIVSMMMIIIFFFQAVFFPPQLVLILAAGALGLINWILAAVGVGLCLSGPRAPGHWGYGISAAVAVAVHAILLTAVVARGNEFSVGQTGHDQDQGVEEVERWGLLPTRIDATMFYLTAICYPDEQGAIPKGSMVLSMITGVAEMTRTVLIMMLLSCLSRAALDEDLAHKCTRAAGIASFAPGILALGMLAFIAALVETNATINLFTVILLLVVMMGTYSILAGVIFPALLAAREVTDACEEPFQSLIPKL
jgi:LSD1 subclass zinc finger protein